MVKSVFILVVVLFLTCSPDRDNPYDPNSDFYTNTTQISGVCNNRVLVPIDNVKISLFPLNNRDPILQTLTNENGSYKLIDCPAESVLIIAEKDGFVSDSIYLSLNVYKSETLNFTLEGLPRFLEKQVTSYFCVINNPPYDSSILSIKCELDDEEGQGDIASVFATIDGLSDSLTLLFSSGNLYENLFQEDSLSDNLDNIIGRDIHIIARDRFSNLVQSSPSQLIRIIRNPPGIISPSGLEIVSSQPLLIWTTQQYLFSHTLFCEIYQVPYPLPPVLYRRYENIVTADTTFQVTDSLFAGYYYWQIGVRDNFGNWAKSAEGVFEVR